MALEFVKDFNEEKPVRVQLYTIDGSLYLEAEDTDIVTHFATVDEEGLHLRNDFDASEFILPVDKNGYVKVIKDRE